MWERIKALWAKAKAQLASLWDKDKGIIILIAIGGIFFKFRDILIDILIDSSKRVKENADKQDTKLAGEEASLKHQADDAVQKAKEEPLKQEPVTDDWYKKPQ